MSYQNNQDEETALLDVNPTIIENATPAASNFKYVSIAAAGLATLGLVSVASVSHSTDISSTAANFITIFTGYYYDSTGDKGCKI